MGPRKGDETPRRATQGQDQTAQAPGCLLMVTKPANPFAPSARAVSWGFSLPRPRAVPCLPSSEHCPLLSSLSLESLHVHPGKVQSYHTPVFLAAFVDLPELMHHLDNNFKYWKGLDDMKLRSLRPPPE